jgi:hypothetical protein
MKQALEEVQSIVAWCFCPLIPQPSGYVLTIEYGAIQVPTAEVGVWLWVGSHNIHQSYTQEGNIHALFTCMQLPLLSITSLVLHAGSVGMTAEEDSQTMLQLTVLEFTARLHAVSPVSTKVCVVECWMPCGCDECMGSN